MEDFAQLSIRDVRDRVAAFAEAQETLYSWSERRVATSERAADEHELKGFRAEVQSGNPAGDWRALEDELRKRALWQVGELPPEEQLAWAQRTRALSQIFREPTRVQRPQGPQPKISRLD